MTTTLNRLPLPNLPQKTKLVYTALLVAGLAVFTESWRVILASLYGSGSDGAHFGVLLGTLAWEKESEFRRLLLLHVVGLLVVILPAVRLFRLTSIRRRVKAVIMTLAALAVIVDLGAWSYSPQCSSTNLLVGYGAGLAALLVLGLAIVPLYQMWVFVRWRSPFGRPARVVVVGGGFGGLYAAQALHRSLGYSPDLEITVVDRNNYFLFPPLLPSAATGSIETRQVCYPFRRIFETSNICFRKMEVTKIDPVQKTVTGEIASGEDRSTVVLDYDYLILAPGSENQTYDTPGAVQHAFFLRELGDAVRLRNHVIERFERAAVLGSKERQEEELRFVVVGAGPTGVEIATELHDLIHHILLKRYPEIDPAAPRITIVQSGQQVLPGWEASIVEKTTRQLERLKLEVIFGQRVTQVGIRSVTLSGGRVLAARTIVWCAGVKPSPLISRSGLATDRSGRVPVGPDLRVTGHGDVFVLGDAAHYVDPRDEKLLPPLGQVAVQQGAHAGKTVSQLLQGKDPQPFRYLNYGGLVSIGEHNAAIEIMGLRLSGFVAWVIWRSLYLTKIVGFSNKVRVMIDWTLDLLIERSFAQIGPEKSLDEPGSAAVLDRDPLAQEAAA